MTPYEAATVLAVAASFDKRTGSEIEARAWAEAFPEWLTPDEAKRAIVKHYGRTTAYLMPAHIVEIAAIDRDIQRQRNAVERGLPSAPPAKPETKAAVRAHVAAVLASRKPASEEAI